MTATFNLIAAEQFYADDANVDADTVAVYLPETIALEVLKQQGWTREPCRGGAAYVKPGKTLRADGGRFGHDYLWELDEAVRLAITAEVV